jgi:hypothetical protein
MYVDDVAHSSQEPRARMRVNDVASNICQAWHMMHATSQDTV